jgi:putative transposon-encoded protein
MRRIQIKHDRVILTDGIIGFFEKVVTPFGTGAKIDCPKEFLGRRVYVIIRKE